MVAVSLKKAARRVILLADSTKFRLPAFCTICDLGEIDALVTDDSADPGDLEVARARGVTVSLVSAPREAPR